MSPIEQRELADAKADHRNAKKRARRALVDHRRLLAALRAAEAAIRLERKRRNMPS